MMISPVHAPIIFANGQAYQIQGQFAIPLPPNEVRSIVLNNVKIRLYVFQLNAFAPLGPMGPGMPLSAGKMQ
jgi:hypothetical protein